MRNLPSPAVRRPTPWTAAAITPLLACLWLSGCFDFAALRGEGGDGGISVDLSAESTEGGLPADAATLPADGHRDDLSSPESDLAGTKPDLAASAPDLTSPADLYTPPDFYGCPFACLDKHQPGHVCVDAHCGCNVVGDCNPDVGDTCVNHSCVCGGKLPCTGKYDCAHGVCLLTGGEPCTSPSQCASNLCIGGFCN